MLKPFLELGRIVGTHGVRGELRVQPWCDTPSFLCKFSTVYLGTEKKAFHVLSARPHKNIALVRLEGITTVEQADQIRGQFFIWIAGMQIGTRRPFYSGFNRLARHKCRQRKKLWNPDRRHADRRKRCL